MNWRNRVQGFFDTSNILSYVIGTATLTIFLQLLYDLSKMIASQSVDKDWGQILGGFILASVLLLVCLVVLSIQIQNEKRRHERRQTQVKIDESKQEIADKKPGLITLVSPRGKSELGKQRRSVPSEESIRFQDNALKVCWLLASKQSLDTALEIRDDLKRKGVHVWCADSKDDLSKLIDAESAEHTYKAVINILDGDLYGLAISDIVADITGSQKPATIGMALASLERSLDMVYVKTERDNTGKDQPDAAIPVLIKIDAKLT